MNASFLGRLLGIKGAGHPEGTNPVPRTKQHPGTAETFLFYVQVVLGLLDIYHQSEKDLTWRGNSFTIALGILSFALKTPNNLMGSVQRPSFPCRKGRPIDSEHRILDISTLMEAPRAL